MKSDKILYIIHLDIEYLIKKIGPDNPKNFSKSEIGEPVPCGYSM